MGEGPGEARTTRAAQESRARKRTAWKTSTDYSSHTEDRAARTRRDLAANCGARLVDWNRVHARDLGDTAYTFQMTQERSSSGITSGTRPSTSARSTTPGEKGSARHARGRRAPYPRLRRRTRSRIAMGSRRRLAVTRCTTSQHSHCRRQPPLHRGVARHSGAPRADRGRDPVRHPARDPLH